MNFLQKLLQGIAFVPAVVSGIEGLFGSRSGREKKDSAISFVTTALQLSEAVANREIVDEEKFKEGLSKVIEGTVACLTRPVGRERISSRNNGGVLMRKLFTIVLVLGVLPLENQARDVAAALSGSIVAAQAKYQGSCTANPSQQICQAINRGVSGENALITAVETYCGWAVTPAPPDPNAKCVAVKSAQAVLQAAVANALALTLQIKGAL